MNGTNLILSCLFDGTRSCQTALKDGQDAASCASLKTKLHLILREVDALEMEIRTLSSSRGLEFDGLPPISHILAHGRARIRLHFRNSDSAVAEMLINTFSKTVIPLMKSKNQCHDPEPQTEYLTQRYLGCVSAAVRNLQEYL